MYLVFEKKNSFRVHMFVQAGCSCGCMQWAMIALPISKKTFLKFNQLVSYLLSMPRCGSVEAFEWWLMVVKITSGTMW